MPVRHQLEFYGFCSIHISTIACSCLPAAPQWMVGDNSTALYRGGLEIHVGEELLFLNFTHTKKLLSAHPLALTRERTF